MKSKLSLALIILISVSYFKSFCQSNNKDTTFVLKENKNGVYHAIYVDFNKASKYYNWISDFQFDNSDSLGYAESIKFFFGDKPVQFNKQKIKYIPRQWCDLYLWKGTYYVYAPSDWGTNSRLQITDTTIFEFNMDGPNACILDSFKTLNKSTFGFFYSCYESEKFRLLIHIIDKKNGVAIFEYVNENEASRFRLMVDAKNVKLFPIIVNYCNEQKQLEYKFEEPDYKSLLKIKR